MCQDCPTRRSRLRAVRDEVVGSLLLPVVLYGLVIGVLVLGYRGLP